MIKLNNYHAHADVEGAGDHQHGELEQVHHAG